MYELRANVRDRQNDIGEQKREAQALKGAGASLFSSPDRGILHWDFYWLSENSQQ